MKLLFLLLVFMIGFILGSINFFGYEGLFRSESCMEWHIPPQGILVKMNMPKEKLQEYLEFSKQGGFEAKPCKVKEYRLFKR